MSYSVYKHTFPNEKVYIGITSMKPEKRWNYGHGYDRNQPLMKNAIQKYGWDNIFHEILFDGLTKEEAEQKEIELIEFYNSSNRKFGYNVQLGGNSNGKLSEETKRKIGDSNKGEKSYWYNHEGYWNGKHHSEETKEKIKEFMNSNRNPNYGKQCSEEIKRKISESQILKRGKPVRCIETEIVYRSLKDANRQTSIDRKSIGLCCNGKQKTAGGCHWEYIENNDEIIGIPVRCIETGVVYNSINQASKNSGIYRSGISGACNKTQKTAGGYHWEFVKDDN